MLDPELTQLLESLIELKGHEKLAGLVIEDEMGGRWKVSRAYAVGMRTDDPGLVLRLHQN